MRIYEAARPTRDIDQAERFYGETLELPVHREATTLVVAVGRSRIVFEQAPYDGSQHLAFTIPTGTFPQAKQWIAARARLVSRDGADEFEGPPGWNSRSVYFDGPDGQVLELIERRALQQPADRPFGPSSLQCLSEVGLAVPDVLRAVGLLRPAGVLPYGTEPGPDFAAVGDVDGLLILVTPGRAWKPTDDRFPRDAPAVVTADVISRVEITPTQTLVPRSSRAR
jgi:catechol 2,3-dioxygenase-like lactoylglutathione lyase family enzyme